MRAIALMPRVTPKQNVKATRGHRKRNHAARVRVTAKAALPQATLNTCNQRSMGRSVPLQWIARSSDETWKITTIAAPIETTSTDLSRSCVSYSASVGVAIDAVDVSEAMAPESPARTGLISRL